jgi:hypothetical protein
LIIFYKNELQNSSGRRFCKVVDLVNGKGYLTSIVFLLVLVFSSEVISYNCPSGTWNRNQYTGPGGGMYTGPGGGLYTGPGGGLYTGPGGGLYTGPGQYCTNRPPLSILVELGILD